MATKTPATPKTAAPKVSPPAHRDDPAAIAKFEAATAAAAEKAKLAEQAAAAKAAEETRLAAEAKAKADAEALAAEQAEAERLAAEAKAETDAKARGPNEAALGPVVVVTGPKRGFRRAGRSFGREAVRIPLRELSDADLAAIQGEPRLVSAIEG